jgi:hypothetical protein
MLNSASKYLKIALKVIFSKPEKKFPPKNQVEGDIALESFEGGFIPIPPLAETLISARETGRRICQDQGF